MLVKDRLDKGVGVINTEEKLGYIDVHSLVKWTQASKIILIQATAVV